MRTQPPSPDSRPALMRYSIAFLSVQMAFVLLMLSPPGEPSFAFLVIFPSVLVASWYGGWGPGLGAMILGALEVWAVGMFPLRSLLQLHLSTSYYSALMSLPMAWIAGSGVYSSRQHLARTRQALSEAAFQIRSAEEAARMAAYDFDIRAGKLRWSNKRLKLGELLTRSHVRTWLDHVHPQDRGEVRHAVALAITTKQPFEIECRIVIPDERRTEWVHTRGQFVFDALGRPLRAMGVIMSIAPRNRAVEALMELASIVESSDDAIIGQALDGTILSWNAAAERIYGYSADEMRGRSESMLLPADKARETEHFREMIRAGKSVEQVESVRLRKDGNPIQVSLTVSPIKDAEGNVVGASTIARDITALKQAERALRLHEKLAATGRLAASIAHEINNPLAAVTNLLFLVQNDFSLSESIREYVISAQREVERMTRIVRQMLSFYRESTAPVATSLPELIDDVISFHYPKIKSAQVRVETRYDFHAQVPVYPSEIRQVFSNLLLNALEVLGDRGQIKVHVFASRDWDQGVRRGVRVVIADNGPGMPRENRRKIFEPFFTTKGEGGTGLGLWVSYGIIEKHDGFIRVWSSNLPGRSGTVFCIFLPQTLGHRSAYNSSAA